MPYIDHNNPAIIDTIKSESEKTKDVLRRLRHAIEQGQTWEPPLALITELGKHASMLSCAISQYTVRHDFVAEGGNVHHSTYDRVITFAQQEALMEPSLLFSREREEQEYELYRDLGFSDQEYKDLLEWKKFWQKNNYNLEAAFNEFAGYVVSELQAGRYSIKAEDIAPGVAGIVGIAVDVVFFATAAQVPALVTSCATGLAAIAAKFSEVRRKLLGRGRSFDEYM